jgi:DNA polymerase III subunit beta
MTALLDARTSMKAICPRKALFDAVQTVGHAVSGRNPLPILSHILIHADGDGLRLMATDLEIGISCRVADRTGVIDETGDKGGARPSTQILEPGALTSPARLLTEVLANLPDKDDVAISVDKSHTVRIHCEYSRSDYKILGLPAEDYPKLPEVRDDVGFAVPQSRLRELIRQTLFAVSTDEARAILTGILVVFEDDAVKFVATDTHRLAVRETRVTEGRGGPQKAIVPARAMTELARLLTDAEGDVRVTLSNNQIQFSLPGENEIQIVSRLIEGQFPNYQRVIPASHQKKLTVEVDALLRAVRRASIVARENAHRIVFRTDEDKLILTAESQMVGNAREEVEVEREGEDVEIAFNAKYLLDVLNVLDTEKLQLELTEPLKPGVMRPISMLAADAPADAGDGYLCVLMPMQIV